MSKHVTAMGRSIDMAAMRTRHEQTRAVGNMNVNARGDIIDSEGRVIDDNSRRVNRMYQQTMQNPQSRPPQPAPEAARATVVQNLEPDREIRSVDDIDLELMAEENPAKDPEPVLEAKPQAAKTVDKPRKKQ